MCIGNRDGGDDAIGPYVADKLQKESNITVLDCGTVPENYTSVVKKHKPQTLIIIDAVEMNEKPGTIKIVPKEKIGTMHISTHGIPISLLIEYLEKYVGKIFLIGVQPATMSGELTSSVKKSGEKLVTLIINKKTDQIEILK